MNKTVLCFVAVILLGYYSDESFSANKFFFEWKLKKRTIKQCKKNKIFGKRKFKIFINEWFLNKFEC